MPRGASVRKQVEWRERLECFQQSGVTASQFCHAGGVSQATFYAWRRRLNEQPEGRKVRRARKAAQFLPVQVTQSADIEFSFPNGARMRLPAHDRELLRFSIQSVATAELSRGTS